MSTRLEDIRLQKIEKLTKIKEIAYDPFEIEKYDVKDKILDLRSKYDTLKNEESGNAEHSIAGRVTGIRSYGKMMFIDLKDMTGKIQLLFRQESLGEKEYEIAKLIGSGDIAGAKGIVSRTKAGELSLHVKSFLILSKNIMPLPDSHFGLQDAELKYRKRYVDLNIDDSSKDTLIKRSKVIESVRKILQDKGFIEVETPMLNSLLGGASAKPFITHHNALDTDLYLRVAPELYLKRLTVGGLEKVFEIGKNFRNEGIDFKHNPEFTSMELYWAYADYEDIMNITEEIIKNAVLKANGTLELEYEGKKISFDGKWKRISMVEAVKEKTGIDFDKISDDEARELAKKHKIEVKYDTSKGKILSEFFGELVEKTLIEPTFVTKHPVETSPLAKRDPKNKAYTNRFELFINGWEIANAFSELNDPFDQYQRFKHQLELKAKGDDEANDMDYDFIEALETGLPPTGGLGIGIDRLVMLVTNRHSIQDVIAFPLMRNVKSTLQDILEQEDKKKE